MYVDMLLRGDSILVLIPLVLLSKRDKFPLLPQLPFLFLPLLVIFFEAFTAFDNSGAETLGDFDIEGGVDMENSGSQVSVCSLFAKGMRNDSVDLEQLSSWGQQFAMDS